MRKIEWTPSAVSDVKSLRDFNARDSSAYSERFVQRLIAVV
jgi:plasmid stabilization system protein ParE